MPELPEVEVTRQGLLPRIRQRTVSEAIARTPRLRYPLPAEELALLRGQTVHDIRRRGKYLLFDFGTGHLLIHLGMSGSLRLVDRQRVADKHDHFDLVFEQEVLRLRDPRRFGAILWLTGDPLVHPLLHHLGPEPLSRTFTAAYLHGNLRTKRVAIKLAIMDANVVVGVGNIYASESLFRAGIDPRTPAQQVSPERLEKLVAAIRQTLRAAIRAGGSSLRDYYGCDGNVGAFQMQHLVYARPDQTCRKCGSSIKMLRQGNRSTYYCPRCQQ